MCSLGACHTPSGGGSRCYSTCLPDHPPPSLAVQTHILTAPLFSFSCAGFLFYFTLFSFSSSHFVHLTSLFLQPLHQIRQKNNISGSAVFFFPHPHDMLHLPAGKAEAACSNVCLQHPKASGHLMAWMGPPVSCSWPVTPSGCVDLCQVPLYHLLSTLPTPRLHPASSSILQQWATVTEPHCVWCGCTQTQPLLPFQKAQPSTWVIFKGICSVKYLAGAGHEGELVRCG